MDLIVRDEMNPLKRFQSILDASTPGVYLLNNSSLLELWRELLINELTYDYCDLRWIRASHKNPIVTNKLSNVYELLRNYSDIVSKLGDHRHHK